MFGFYARSFTTLLLAGAVLLAGADAAFAKKRKPTFEAFRGAFNCVYTFSGASNGSGPVSVNIVVPKNAKSATMSVAGTIFVEGVGNYFATANLQFLRNKTAIVTVSLPDLPVPVIAFGSYRLKKRTLTLRVAASAPGDSGSGVGTLIAGKKTLNFAAAIDTTFGNYVVTCVGNRVPERRGRK